jgi:hypothetical protein
MMMEDWIRQEAVQGVGCQEISNTKYSTPNTEVAVKPDFRCLILDIKLSDGNDDGGLD